MVNPDRHVVDEVFVHVADVQCRANRHGCGIFVGLVAYGFISAIAAHTLPGYDETFGINRVGCDNLIDECVDLAAVPPLACLGLWAEDDEFIKAGGALLNLRGDGSVQQYIDVILKCCTIGKSTGSVQA